MYPSLILSLLRSFKKRCPRCGKGKLFSSYLKPNLSCSHCNEDLSIYRTDDFGSWLTIIMSGIIIIPLILTIEQTYAPPLWIQAVIWIPITLTLVLLLLPIAKGTCLTIMWIIKMKQKEEHND